jgi:hypothetical protein
MGNFVQEHQPKRKHSYDRCPLCGTLKSSTAKVCIACHGRLMRDKEIKTRYERDEGFWDRHRRWGLAMEAGWAIKELCALARKGQLPTDEQIEARMAQKETGE